MTAASVSRAVKLSMTVIGIGAVLYHMLMVQWQIQGSTYHYITHLFLAIDAEGTIQHMLREPSLRFSGMRPYYTSYTQLPPGPPLNQ